MYALHIPTRYWRGEYEKCHGNAQNNKRIRQTQHPEVTEMLDLWVARATASSILLTGEVLRQKWKDFADMVGIPDDERLTLSDGWLEKYKGHTGLKQFKWRSKAGSVGMEDVNKERNQTKAILQGYEPHNVYNMDETGLFYVYDICSPLYTILTDTL